MKAGFPSIFAMLVLSLVAMPGLRAQYLYSVVDTTDGVSFTYESSELITTTTAGTSTDGAFTLYFQPEALVYPVVPRSGIVQPALSEQPIRADILTALFGSNGGVAYDFPAGTFDSLGAFSSPIQGYASIDGSPYQKGTLTITATPEPGPFVLVILGGVVLVARQRWMQGARVKAA